MLRTLTVACLATFTMTIPARSEEQVLYGAGSLRKAMAQIRDPGSISA